MADAGVGVAGGVAPGTPLRRSTCADGDHPDRALVMVGLPRVAAILQRIAADVDDLAHARPRGRPRSGRWSFRCRGNDRLAYGAVKLVSVRSD